MNDIDLKLRLFSGEPIEAKNYGLISPLKIREIIRFGYMKYMKLLNIICLETNDLFSDVDDEDLLKEDVFDLLIAFGGEEMEKQLEDALTLFLHGEAMIDKENLSVILKFKGGSFATVNNSNYKYIQEVIRWQNYVNSFEEKDDNFNPANEEALKLKKRMDELKRKRDEIKRKNNEEEEKMDFFDIISSLASKSYSINELNVVDLTIYQLYRKFKRIDAIDQYDINIRSMLAGAQNIKLKHWSSSLED